MREKENRSIVEAGLDYVAMFARGDLCTEEYREVSDKSFLAMFGFLVGSVGFEILDSGSALSFDLVVVAGVCGLVGVWSLHKANNGVVEKRKNDQD